MELKNEWEWMEMNIIELTWVELNWIELNRIELMQSYCYVMNSELFNI